MCPRTREYPTKKTLKTANTAPRAMDIAVPESMGISVAGEANRLGGRGPGPPGCEPAWAGYRGR